jgi:phosphoglycerate kinase
MFQWCYGLGVIGGGMIFTFLKARGHKIGKSLVEEKFLDMAKELERKASKRGIPFYIPEDVVIAKSIDKGAEHRVVPSTEIPDGWIGVDIGPLSRQYISKQLGQSKTVLWNGPMVSHCQRVHFSIKYSSYVCVGMCWSINGYISIGCI